MKKPTKIKLLLSIIVLYLGFMSVSYIVRAISSSSSSEKHKSVVVTPVKDSTFTAVVNSKDSLKR